MGLPSEVNNLLLASDSGPSYRITRSVRFRQSATAYFARTPSVAGNQRVWTFSAWVKRGDVEFINSKNLFSCSPNSNNRSIILFDGNNSDQGLRVVLAISNVYYNVTTTVSFRDPTAWYHILVATDTTLATGADRVKIYVNGVQQTTTSSGGASVGYPALNAQYNFNSASLHRLGAESYNTSNTFDGLMAEVHWIDGSALSPSDFGFTDPITGVWMPKDYTGNTASYGTNGFYLPFTDNSGATSSTIGKDNSGNSNDWTPTNISVTSGVTYDSFIDSPTNYGTGTNARGNYCTLNPLSRYGTNQTLTAANLQFTGTSSSRAIGTMGMSSGKWYWEAQTTAANLNCGVSTYNYSPTPTYYTTSVTNTDLAFRFDADAGVFSASTDGVTWTTVQSGLTNGPYFPILATSATGSKTISANFGQRPFTYSPPTGYKPLCTTNMQTPSILNGSQYMTIASYAGNGTSQTITNTSGMAPDLVWFRSRANADNPYLFDTTRGATNVAVTNANTAFATNVNTLTAFNSNGFSVGSNANVNRSSGSFLAWQWKKSAVAGFDIVTYTGTGVNRTVAHNLGAVPRFMIIKAYGTDNWRVYHASLGNTAGFLFDSAGAATTSATYWNNTTPTSSVFTVGTGSTVNANGVNYIGYLWADVEGFSKIGSYSTTPSSLDVYLGFRPRFILFKASTSASWSVVDTAANSGNVANKFNVNESSSEQTGDATAMNLDVVSNGFVLRNDGSSTTALSRNNNTIGNTIYYVAFAENPFTIARAE